MSDATTFRSFNPARPDEVIGDFPVHTPSDVDSAVRGAAAAQREWAKIPIPARAERISAVGDLLAARKEEFTSLVVREAGKIVIEAGGDVQEAIDMAYFVAGQGRAAWGTTHPSEMASKVGWTTRQPVGVVGMITPWNFPVAIPSWKIFPALLAGNGVVIKPSELAPACARAFVDACVESGIPRELVQVVYGFGEVGGALATHELVRAVSFTGSVEVGRKVAVAAMANGPRLVSLELGGKNAMVVMEDADLDLVLDGVLFGAFGTAGQRCTSTSRLLVHRRVVEELTERIVARAGELKIGDPADLSTQVGPVINRAAVERIDRMVSEARDDGATVATGGVVVTPDACDGGTFYAPTVLTGVSREHRIARNEVFGPVLSVLTFDSAEEAFDIVNEVAHAMSAAIYTRNVNLAFQAVDVVNTGIVYVNAPTIGAEIHLPFGGTKHTGNGFREAGRCGLEQFSEMKSVYVDYSGRLQRAQIDNRQVVDPATGDNRQVDEQATGDDRQVGKQATGDNRQVDEQATGDDREVDEQAGK
jgi:alpha-ketoglutaric semialdehyde dehydrogenase